MKWNQWSEVKSVSSSGILQWEGEAHAINLPHQTVVHKIIYIIKIAPDLWHLFDLVAEAQAFDDEWQHKVSEFQPAAQLSRLEAPRARAAHRAAITGPEHKHRFTYMGA